MKFLNKEIADSFTVDIEVENTHNYQLENGVVSHNTVSLLAGATPGLHYPESRFYIRRVRLSNHSKLLKPLADAGYKIEPAFGSEESTVVVEIPIDEGEGIRTKRDLTMWEQLALAAFMQRHWSDNQVSATITFDPETEGPHLPCALNFYQYQLKGISFLPRVEKGAYRQMPYEEITEEEYHKQRAGLKYLSFVRINGETAEQERFCDSQTCLLEDYTPEEEE